MSDPPESGSVVAGRYQVERLLGKGGMGAVYLARQLSMDRMVALKLIHPHLASPEVAKRFHREMQATSRIAHPNTVQVFDYGADESGNLFLVMEFLDGKSLAKLLDESGALPPARLLHIAEQVVRALGAAHEQGITHRDLKPDNVMLIDRYGEHDYVKVLDFGIARFMDTGEGASQMTAEGAVVGTPLYMSPEQAQGLPVDHRADFYSLGVMLYQMALGRPPFVGPTMASLLVAHAHDLPPTPSKIAPGRIAPAIEALILRLLSKSPEARPATAAELLHQLEECRGGKLALERTQAESAAVQRRPPRSTLWLLAAALLLSGGAAALWLQHSDSVGAAARARLDALQLADGDPPAPAECRARDPRLLDGLCRASAWLHDSTIGSARPQDTDALALLTNYKDGAASAEYQALLSRARLVVEPTADGALQAAERAVQLCPQLALAHNLVGNAEQRARHAEPAAAAYHRALALAPDYLAPRFNLGLLSLRAGDAEGALMQFDAVLQKNPLHPRAHLARGQARLLVGQLAAAVEDLEAAVLRQPEEPTAWLLLGNARAKSGSPQGALEAWCKAKSLGSDEAKRLCP